jgi:hypothetical protein
VSITEAIANRVMLISIRITEANRACGLYRDYQYKGVRTFSQERTWANKDISTKQATSNYLVLARMTQRSKPRHSGPWGPNERESSSRGIGGYGWSRSIATTPTRNLAFSRVPAGGGWGNCSSFCSNPWINGDGAPAACWQTPFMSCSEALGYFRAVIAFDWS